MKIVVTMIICFSILIGGGVSEESFSMFKENGNLKEVYVKEMQKEWCEHNKDREFARKRCK